MSKLDDLKKQRAAWIEQLNGGLFLKLYTIVTKLGDDQYLRRPGLHKKFEYGNVTLAVVRCQTGTHLPKENESELIQHFWVFVNGFEACNITSYHGKLLIAGTKPDSNVFVPGIWIDTILRKYPEAKSKLEGKLSDIEKLEIIELEHRLLIGQTI